MTGFQATARLVSYIAHGITCQASYQWGLRLIAQHRRIRWYNPKLKDFEWREVPESDEEALAALASSPHTPACTQTYREWRALGANIPAALIRAGEAAEVREVKTSP
jgi:hypothetical protein